MNSKERVLKAIEHREPDRVPLDYGAWRQVSEGLCQRLGLDATCEWSHFQEFPEALLQRLHIDLRVVRARYLGRPPDSWMMAATLISGASISPRRITRSAIRWLTRRE